jgi:cytoskeletal protein RodZ
MSRTTVASERRTRQRKRPPSLIYVELGSSNGGMMRDLSEKGFAMRAMIPLRADESTTFAFTLDSSLRLEGTCKVLWVEENGRVAGLQFTDVPPDLRRQVRTWLQDQQNPAPNPALASNSEPPPASTMQQLRGEIRSVPARPEIPVVEAAAIPAAEPEVQTAPELPPAPPVSTLQRLRKELRAAPARPELPVVGPAVIPPPRSGMQAAPKSSPAAPRPEALVSAVVPEARLPEASAVPAETFIPKPTPAPATLPRLPDVELPFESFKPRAGMERSLVSLGVRMMLLFALIAVGVVFHQEVGNSIIWLGTKIAGSSAPEISPIIQNDISPSVPATSSDFASSTPSPSASESAQTSSAAEHKDEPTAAGKADQETAAGPDTTSTLPAKNPAPVAPGAVLPVARSTTPPSATAAPGLEPGQSEFLAAQDLLKKNSNSELPEAVKLLWAAVEKGNANAEVALAELYRQGKGVAKNCDQTNILLSAAARKGNALAQRLLREFQGESCE